MKLSGMLLACLLLIPAVVRADNFNYDYLELNYLHDAHDSGESSKGPQALISWTVPELDVQVLAGYAHLNTPASPANINSKNSLFGIRAENDFSDATSFYTDILYINDESNPFGLTVSNTGFRLRLGMRHRLLPRLELDASLAHDYLSGSSNQAALGLLFNVTSYLAVGASYAHDSLKNNTASLRLRVYY